MKHFISLLALAICFYGCSDNTTAENRNNSNDSIPIQEEQVQDTIESIPETSAPIKIDTNQVIHALIEAHSKGFELERLFKGDLNADGRDDVMAIASRTCSEQESVSKYSMCYGAYLFIAQQDGSYELAKYNDDIIACSDCEHGMPQIELSSGLITIKRTLGACVRDMFTELYRFDPSDQNWYLKEIQRQTLNCNGVVNGEVVVEELPTQTDEDFGVILF